MEYSEAVTIAKKCVEQLNPHCERIIVAGSIRRERLHVKDIELVVIPKPYEVGLFENGFASIVNSWEHCKGHLPCKYAQRMVDGIKIDIFIVEYGNWGSQLAMRTGSAEFSHKVLGRAWVNKGYKMEGGYLTYNGKPVATPNEREFFNRIGVDYIDPNQRNLK
jgi:DNA polymerase/3'-5' exonuclease PolX